MYDSISMRSPTESGPLHVLLVRAGHTQNEAIDSKGDLPSEVLDSRQADSALSALGQQQATVLGDRLGTQLKTIASSGKVQLTCSSMKSALATAFPLSQALRQSVIVNPDLVEKQSSAKDARIPGRATIAKQYPTFDASLVAEHSEVMEEGEDAAQERAARVAAALHRETLGEGGERLVVVVSHGAFLAHLARALLEFTPAAVAACPSSLELNHASTSHVVLPRRAGGGKAKVIVGGTLPTARLLHWNRTDHLGEFLRTGIDWKTVTGSGATWARHGEGGTGLSPVYAEGKVVETAFDRRTAVRSQAAFVATGTCRGHSRAEWLRAFAILLVGFCLGAVTAMGLTGEFGGVRVIGM
mmetsp:Transcript_43675/g.114772  ORF Transcript_43675/g.114772 Transcript_43675/m.114772 type:complete len:356 (+) Transcript_43675:71-1138(+)